MPFNIYKYGKLLNQIAFAVKNPDAKRKFIFIYSALINNLTISEISKRWNYEKVCSFLQSLLSNYEESLICIHIPLTIDNCLPGWFLKRRFFNSICLLPLTDDYESCQFENQLLRLNPASDTIAVPANSTRRSFTMKIPVIFVFHRDFPCEIRMLQTNHEKFYFHKNSFLIFQPNCFCYAIIYTYGGCFSFIATYNYKKIVDLINSLQENTLLPMNAEDIY